MCVCQFCKIYFGQIESILYIEICSMIFFFSYRLLVTKTLVWFSISRRAKSNLCTLGHAGLQVSPDVGCLCQEAYLARPMDACTSCSEAGVLHTCRDTKKIQKYCRLLSSLPINIFGYLYYIC